VHHGLPDVALSLVHGTPRSRYQLVVHGTPPGRNREETLAVITLLNQKGGVGKSSTCHHLAGTLAQLGRRVLLVDNDPQSSLTQGLWGPTAARSLDPSETMAAVYSRDAFPDQVVKPSGVDGVDIVAGSRFVNDWNLPRPFEAPYEAQASLREFLEPIRAGYDFVLIDCPPNLCLCSWAALVASDCLIVPLQAEDYGAQGIMDVQDSVSLVTNGPNPSLRLLGYLITMFNPRKTVHRMYETQLRELYGAEVFATMVPYAADYPEAIAYRKPVALYKPKGAAAKAIRALADEVTERLVHGATQTEAA
jgi:chromosome partitioning protein